MTSKKGLLRASLSGGVSFVVLAGALCCALVGLVSGCGRDGGAPVSPSAPASAPSHRKDPVLKAQLESQREERGALLRARQTIIAKMEALVAAKYKGDMKAAAADPEMASLIRRARDIETNLSTNRAHAAEMIRASALRSAAARGSVGVGSGSASGGGGGESTKTSKKEVKQ